MKIKILAKDIKNTNYTNQQDCAITRALKRAGLKNLKDEGINICIKNTGEEVLNQLNKNYDKLVRRIIRMYRYAHPGKYIDDNDKEKPVDFTVDLPLAKFRTNKKRNK